MGESNFTYVENKFCCTDVRLRSGEFVAFHPLMPMNKWIQPKGEGYFYFKYFLE
ncbi:hypothetical protein HMPREF1074_04508 [Bacteroides xylanisolvens CL03T12C04]|uniref:Uncharacterized protein n=1 Tax=Bacteroides xylanisolvens CL03T12C04 TaxID=997892 RepID=I9A9S0_9BACE|nr:hypothetical protein HMPREF1074_04508 [Bacteroides xylanisolvens CL03T12C04]MBT0704404.1 hypothetical protein [Bacteroides xylanisolvens CL03T12C04]